MCCGALPETDTLQVAKPDIIVDEAATTYHNHPERAMPIQGMNSFPEGWTSQKCFEKKDCYKFKNDIKLRFSDEQLHQTETSESFALAGESTHVLDKPSEFSPHRPKDSIADMFQISCSEMILTTSQRPPPSLSSNSDKSSKGSNMGETSSNSSCSSGYNSEEQQKKVKVDVKRESKRELKNSIPGFALHPMGAYYVPVVLSANLLQPHISKSRSSSSICYPISIPVRFDGNCAVMSGYDDKERQETRLDSSHTSSDDRHQEQQRQQWKQSWPQNMDTEEKMNTSEQNGYRKTYQSFS